MRKLKQSMPWGILLASCLATSSLQAAEPTLRWLGHAAFQFSTQNGKIFLIDPWLTNPKAPQNLKFPHVDAILVTHAHSDHVGEAFDLAKQYNAPLIASYELTQIAQKKGVKKVLPLNASGSVSVAGVTVTGVQAVHSSGYADGENVLYAGAPLGFVVTEPGSMSFYHAGDTGVFSDMAMIAELYSPQIVLLPIGGVYTMKPPEAAIAARNLRPRAVVPMHFGTFPALAGTPDQLRTEMKRIGALSVVKELPIGKTLSLAEIIREK